MVKYNFCLMECLYIVIPHTLSTPILHDTKDELKIVNQSLSMGSDQWIINIYNPENFLLKLNILP